ncbi:MAG TPA: aminopeptidase [Lachnospiraceae bacterium]|nr:aminopeptidase [Lachnospiraceae bacterium]
MIKERYLLAKERIQETMIETTIKEPFNLYFKEMAAFLQQMIVLFEEEKDVDKELSLVWLQDRNQRLFIDILQPSYDKSYANPEVALFKLGDEYGQIFSFLYVELRSLIEAAFEQDLFEMVIRMELFLEIYSAFSYSFEEIEKQPKVEEIKQIIYWFVSDYSEPAMEKRIREQLDPECNFATKIIMTSDLEDVRYLYRFGEYITDNQLKIAKHLNALSEETIQLMAKTYTEGFRMGFILGNKDLSKKKVVNIRYSIGFERVVKQAILNFEEMGLKPTIYRASNSVFYKRGVSKIGYYGAIPNKQYDYDHKEDSALFLDKNYVNRKLEVLKAAYEEQRELANVHAGPACMEIFGEYPFAPVYKKQALSLSNKQQKLSVEFASESGQIVNEYIKGEERSFTIIAFPVPEIGEQFEEIFNEIIKINTLDYKLYEGIQNTIIDTLNQAEQVQILGTNGNKTDLMVSLHPLTNIDNETKFENCVADVNIPVGEVFTSPVLKGTTGTLFVKKVFLGELEYKKLELKFEDGMISDYSCSNFDNEVENRKYIKDNLLFHHDTLPMGEFAIGTNTTAYVMAGKYQIFDKLPILIAEKMGPHFAVGDTCYSHSEDVKVCNPDGKEIVAKDNELSILRKVDIKKAYFNCHTDITIPYDELGQLVAIKKDGSKIPIIEMGRFVLPGCEKLNEPFENLLR